MFVAHLEDQVSPERKPAPTASVVGRAKNILKYLKEYDNVQFMHFLCDALEPIARLSLKFQEDQLTPGIYCMLISNLVTFTMLLYIECL